MKNLLDNVKVEITVRNPKNIDFEIPGFLNQYLDGRKKDKIIFMVPIDWVGFKNGFSKKLTKSGLDVYLALAYSTTGDERVVDKEGNEVKPFIHHFSGGVLYKYVKKNLTIYVKDGTIIRVYDISLNLMKTNPVVFNQVPFSDEEV
jgi:hypothetical protein